MEYVRDFDYSNLIALKKKSKKVFSRSDDTGKTYIYDLECAFDIETTSYVTEDGEKIGFMYVWVFGIGDYTIYGRTWEDFVTVCEFIRELFELDTHNNLVCYAHNLGFEFQFMRKWFTWYNVFTVNDRKPIRAVTSIGIEFRDSYVLSGMGLEKTAENLTTNKIKKLVGDLDYSLVRTSETPLTQEELDYCENDVLILLYYIKEQRELYGNLARVPLTNTGRVRKFVGDKCYFTDKVHRKSSTRKYTRYAELMQSLQVTESEYKKLKRALQGGYTHSSYNHVGEVIENVGSFDFTSSYPAVMLTEKYPMSAGFEIEINSLEEFTEARKKYALVFDIKFKNLTATLHNENYLSESRSYRVKNAVINNGRIYSADELITTITDVDYSVIERVYQWDEMQIKNVTAYHKGYLPKPIIEAVLELYADKTSLKDVKGKEVEYLVSKGMVNSIFGMSVTDIVRDANKYNSKDGWFTEKADTKAQLKRYNNNRKRFLYYPWGVFVTAYARRNLWSGIIEFGEDYIYSDTDSLKGTNIENHQRYIDRFNEVTMKKLLRMAEHYDIEPERLKPKTVAGVEKPIGMWDYEGTYSRFKTLGAKRYLVEKDGKLEITVAGLSKDNGLDYMLSVAGGDHDKVFDMFNDELYIPAEYTGNMTHSYIDEYKELNVTDYLGHTALVKTKSGVHLEEVEFTLSISKEYGEFLNNFRKGYVYKGVTQTL